MIRLANLGGKRPAILVPPDHGAFLPGMETVARALDLRDR
jgi:hypothetical protein